MTTVTVSAAINSYKTNAAAMTAVSISDSAVNIAANLDQLQAIVGAKKITGIVITGSSTVLALSATQLTNDAGTLAKISSNYTLTVSGVLAANAAKTLATAKVSSISVNDTSAHIAARLDALQANIAKITSITQTDTPSALSITVAQLTADATALSKISGSYTLAVKSVLIANLSTVTSNAHVTSLAVSDSAANIGNTNNLKALLALGTKLTSITETGTLTPITITAAQYDTDLTEKFSNFTANVTGIAADTVKDANSDTKVSSFTVSDTATNLGKTANLTAIESAVTSGKLTSITETGTVAAITLTAAQYNSALTSKFTNFTAKVSGVAAANAATVLADAKVSSITVSDSSAHIAAKLDSLQANIAKITGITQTGTLAPLSITANQLTADATALSKISGTYTLAITNVLAADLPTVLANTHVTSVSIADTAASLVANLVTLQSDISKITAITVTDHIALSITSTQLANDGAVLALIVAGGGSYSVSSSTLSPVSVATFLASVATIGTGVTIADASTAIASNLDALQAHQSQLTSLTLNDTTPLSITESQFTADATVLGKITGTYSLSVSGVLAADIATVFSNSHVNSIALADTGSNIANALGSLTSNNHFAQITSISVTDSLPVVLNYSQYIADITAIAKLASTVVLEVTGVTLGELSAVQSNPQVTSVSLADASSTLLTNLDALEAGSKSGYINAISLTDTVIPTFTLTAQQFLNDQDVLIAMAKNQATSNPAYHLQLATGETLTAAQASSISPLIFKNFIANSVTVKDSAANIDLYATQLQKLTIDPPLGVIVLTDTGAVILHLSAADVNLFPMITTQSPSTTFQIQLTDTGPVTLNLSAADLTLLNNIITQNSVPYSVVLSGVAAADVNSLLSNPLITQVSVSDTAANIQNYWTQLETAFTAHQITGVKVSDGGVISLTDLSTTSFSLLSTLTGESQIILQDDFALDQISTLVLPQNYHLNAPLTISITGTGLNVGWFETLNESSLLNLQTLLNQTPSSTIDLSGFSSWYVATNTLGLDQLTNVKILDALKALNLIDNTPQTTTDAQGFFTFYNSAFYVQIVQPKGLSLPISGLIDSTANIQANLDQLASYVLQGAVINYIQLSDSLPITATVAQVNKDVTILNTIQNAYFFYPIQNTYLLSISDTSANLNTLNVSNLNVKYIELAPTSLDTLTPMLITASNVVDINLTQLTGLANTSLVTYTESAINNGLGTEIDVNDGTHTYVIQLPNVAESQLTIYGYVDPATAIQNIATTATDLSTNLVHYEELAKAGKLGNLTLSDSGTPVIQLTENQFFASSSLLSLIKSPYTLSITNVAAADVSSLLSNPLITQVSISDTAANIQNYWGQLETAITANQISGVTVSDGGFITSPLSDYSPASLSLLSALNGESQIIFQMDPSLGYNSSFSFNNLQDYHFNAPVTISSIGLELDDNSELLSLQSLLNQNPSWNVTFGGVNSKFSILANALELDQLTNSKILDALKVLTIIDQSSQVSSNIQDFQSYYHSVFYTEIAQPKNLKAPINGLTDTAANIQANIDQLAGYTFDPIQGGVLTSIQLTDTLPTTIKANVMQVVFDWQFLNLIQNPYLLSISNTKAHPSIPSIGRFNTNYIELAPTVLNTLPYISATNVFSSSGTVDINLTQITPFTNSSTVTYTESVINNGLGTEVDITDGTNTYIIQLLNIAESQLTIYDYVDPATPVQNITTTASDLTTNLIHYEDLAKAGKLGSLTLNDPLNFQSFTTILQLVEYSNIIGFLQAPTSISAAYASFQAGTLTQQVLIDATSADIMSNLSNISQMSAAGDISGIVVKDATLNTNVLTVGANLALAADYANILSLEGITQFDTGNNTISLNSTETLKLLDSGISLTSHTSTVSAVLNNIVLNSTEARTLANSDITLTTDSSAVSAAMNILDFINFFTSDSLHQLTSIGVSSIIVSDTTGNLYARMEPLHTYFPAEIPITGISIADAIPLSLSETQLTSDANILSKINSDIDGSSGSLIFQMQSPYLSWAQFSAITNWTAGDQIQYSTWESSATILLPTPLSIVGNSGAASAGMGSINATTGIVTFDASDILLGQQIIAVENAISQARTPIAGHVAEWMNENNTYIFIAGDGVSTGDNLIKLVGTDVSHISVAAGGITAV